MSDLVTPIASYRGSSAAIDQRVWNLALAFQEVLTAIVRVRFGRQAVSSAETFRAQIRQALQAAGQDAMSRGYPQADVQLALYAVVAFVDESVLNCRQTAFADWPRLPLQEELFGGHVAGESFFENLQRVLERADSRQTADLLEVFYLCLLLGYRGRYAVSSKGELRTLMGQAQQKIQRVRGGSPSLSPNWAPPPEASLPPGIDRWARRLGWTALVSFITAMLLFGIFKLGLISGITELHTLANQLP
jgi:type VI secretion system protein ImpK